MYFSSIILSCVIVIFSFFTVMTAVQKSVSLSCLLLLHTFSLLFTPKSHFTTRDFQCWTWRTRFSAEELVSGWCATKFNPQGQRRKLGSISLLVSPSVWCLNCEDLKNHVVCASLKYSYSNKQISLGGNFQRTSWGSKRPLKPVVAFFFV